jgi:tetratricopeptide (TPR) repeat protein
MSMNFAFPLQQRSFKLAGRFLDLWLRGGSVPKHVSLISLLVVCSLWSIPKAVHAQALLPHTLQLDAAKLEQQGLRLAQEAAQLGQFQQFELALPRAKLASQLAPNNDRVWFLLGGLHLQAKDYAAAYKAGLKLKPDNAEGLFDLGNAYYMLGRFSDAIAQYNKSFAQDQKFWPAINNIGLINYEQGNIDGAIKQWRASVNIDKQAAEPLLALAVALYNKGDRNTALSMGENAVRIDQRYANLDFLKENLWGERLLADAKKFLALPRIQAALQQSENSSAPR